MNYLDAHQRKSKRVSKYYYFLIVFMLLFGLVGCSSKKESPESTVSNALTAVQKLDQPTMEKYFYDGDKVTDELTGEMEQQNGDISFDEMSALFVEKLSYKILKSEEIENQATVTTEITNINMEKVMSQYLIEVMQYSFSNAFLPEDQQPTEEELEAKSIEIMTNIIKNENIELVTNTVEIKLVYLDNQWKIEMDEHLANAIYGGLVSFFNTQADGKSEKDTVMEVRNWVVSDIWNEGFSDISSYMASGTSATGGTLDIEFTIAELDKAMNEKPEYDAYMAALPTEFAEIKELWLKVSEQIDVLYQTVKAWDLTQNGQGLDTGLYEQYFTAFDEACFALK